MASRARNLASASSDETVDTAEPEERQENEDENTDAVEALASSSEVQEAATNKAMDVAGQLVDKQLEIIDEAQNKAAEFLDKGVSTLCSYRLDCLLGCCSTLSTGLFTNSFDHTFARWASFLSLANS